MLDWTDLKAEMAACWKTGWNVDPLPLSVPLRFGLLLPDADAPLLDVARCCSTTNSMRSMRRGLSRRQQALPSSPAVYVEGAYRGTPYRVYRVWAAASSPVILQTVVCQYSLPASPVPAGKAKMDKTGLKS